MSIQSSTRWLIATAAKHAHPSPLIRFLTPCTIQYRSYRPTHRRPANADEQHPVVADVLRSKNEPTAQGGLVRGDLAGSSIFESEDAGPQPSRGELDPSGKKDGQEARDTAAMAVVLDPRPDNRLRWQRKMVIRSVVKEGRLSKSEQLKRVERESLSKSQMLKTSVKKLNPLARQIAGKTVDEAIVQMRFSKKKVARAVKKQLEHARNEAIVRRGMGLGKVNGSTGEPALIHLKNKRRHYIEDRTAMYIDEAWVGRGVYGREADHRARGNINMMRPPHTSITIRLKEEATRIRQDKEREEKRSRRKTWVALPNRPVTARRSYYCW
ncbi:MAG: hypothetical protein M1825_003987 [Sarcosagium campestre]|nr:MAG: hypothetical protein M1825_003987 [Sarcosagium campestre]